MQDRRNENRTRESSSPDTSVDRTAYRRVEVDLRSRIRNGDWPEGTMLPSRQNLSREYSVAVHTIQRAVARLLDDGTLTADSGRGTFVSAKNAVSRKRVAVRPQVGGWNDPESGLPALRPPLPQTTTLGILATIHDDADISYGLMGISWVNTVISSLERAFSDLGGKTRYFNLRVIGQHSNVDQTFAEMDATGVHAVVGISLYENPVLEDELTARLLRSNRPAAFVTWRAVSQGIPHIFYDQRFAGYRAAQHLLQRDYYPLILPTNLMAPWLEERIAGAREAVRDAGLPAEGLHLIERLSPPKTDEAGAGVATEAIALIAKTSSPTQRWGVIAPHDGRAVGILHAASEADLKAGCDFGLIGFDDDPRSRVVGLTSLRPPLEELGIEAARLIARTLQGTNQSVQIRLNSSVVARSSTDPTPAKEIV